MSNYNFQAVLTNIRLYRVGTLKKWIRKLPNNWRETKKIFDSKVVISFGLSYTGSKNEFFYQLFYRRFLIQFQY
jgi:hypothetical protein